MSDIKTLYECQKDGWSIPGYKVVKTKHYMPKSYSFSPNKDSSRSKVNKEKSEYPDPAKYGETLEQTTKKHWRKASGKFPTGKKKTYIDELVKSLYNVPGPGSYNKLPKNSVPKKDKSRLGKFDKSERFSFMDSVEWKAQETPSSWRYFPVSIKKKIFSSWSKPKQKIIEKSQVGPGYYESVPKAFSKVLKASPNYSFPRSKTPSIYSVKALKNSYIPGVGSYEDSDSAFNKFQLKRERTPVIMPYKIKRFTESIIANAKNIPGPGSYETPSLIVSSRL